MMSKTTKYYVSEANNPHRFQISTSSACCGWTDVFQFYAYEDEHEVMGYGHIKFYVSEAHRPHRFQISKSPACCGWTDVFSFWAVEGSSTSLKSVNRALKEALKAALN